MAKFFLFFLLIFGNSLCFAALDFEECSSIDWRSELGDARDQGETGTCYANTTSDLATQKLGFRVSDIGVVKSFLALDPENLKGKKDPAIEKFLAKDPGIIDRIRAERTKEPERLHPENILSYHTSKDEDGEKSVKYNGLFENGGIEDGALVMANLDGFCRADKLSASGDDEYVQRTQEAYTYAGKYTKNFEIDCPPTQASPVSKTASDLSKVLVKSFSNWVDEKCGERVVPSPALVPQTVSVAKDLEDYRAKTASGELVISTEQNKLFAEIDRNLERHRVSAIGYDYQEQMDGKEKNWDHSAIIAARKMINGQCRYFLRNSIGNNCSVYAKKFQTDSLCEEKQGGVWVSRDDLKSVYSVISVK